MYKLFIILLFAFSFLPGMASAEPGYGEIAPEYSVVWISTDAADNREYKALAGVYLNWQDCQRERAAMQRDLEAMPQSLLSFNTICVELIHVYPNPNTDL